MTSLFQNYSVYKVLFDFIESLLSCSGKLFESINSTEIPLMSALGYEKAKSTPSITECPLIYHTFLTPCRLDWTLNRFTCPIKD